MDSDSALALISEIQTPKRECEWCQTRVTSNRRYYEHRKTCTSRPPNATPPCGTCGWEFRLDGERDWHLDLNFCTKEATGLFDVALITRAFSYLPPRFHLPSLDELGRASVFMNVGHFKGLIPFHVLLTVAMNDACFTKRNIAEGLYGMYRVLG